MSNEGQPDQRADEVWLNGGELTDADRSALDAALIDYQNNPDGGSSWEEVKSRIKAKLFR